MNTKLFAVLAILVLALFAGCKEENGMPETADIAVIDGEDAGSIPWEFVSIVEDGGCTFALNSLAKAHGIYGYRYTADGINQFAYGTFAFIEKTELYARTFLYVPSTFNTSGVFNQVLLFLLRDGNVNVLEGGIMNQFDAYNRWIFQGVGDAAIQETAHWQTDTWHYIDYHFKAGSGGNGGYEIWIDGDSIGSNFTKDWSGYAIDNLILGFNNLTAVADAGDYLDFDDLLLSTTGPIGAYAGGGEDDNMVMVTREGMIEKSWFGLVEHKK